MEPLGFNFRDREALRILSKNCFRGTLESKAPHFCPLWGRREEVEGVLCAEKSVSEGGRTTPLPMAESPALRTCQQKATLTISFHYSKST